MEVTLDTDSIFFEDLLYASSRYAIGRMTGLGTDVIINIYHSFAPKMSEVQKKNYAHNMRDIMFNDLASFRLNWKFDSDFTQEERETLSIIDLVMDTIGSERDVTEIFSATVKHDNDSVKVELEFKDKKDNSFDYTINNALSNLIVWNDLLKAMSGDTFTAICDSGSVSHNEEAVWSYMPIIIDGVQSSIYKKVVRPIENYSEYSYIPDEFVKGINYNKEEIKEN